jgi:hypothetical protein
MDMLGSLIPHLSTLIITVRRNMLSSVVTTCMILGIIVAWSARGNIATWMENNPSEEQRSERIERGRESDLKIARALGERRKSLNADRVLIRQFHSMSDDSTKAIIPYVTTTHIQNAPGVSAPVPQIINMPRAYMIDVTRPMYEGPTPVCIHLPTSSIMDDTYRRFLNESGVYEQYICPIADIDGKPMGFIIAAYLTDTKQRPAKEEIFTMLSETSVRVAGYLNEVIAPERRSWIRLFLEL